jgi:selenocysteine-specific elongation factor SelB
MTTMDNATRNIMLGTAGHVDHGKTALVKLLTGCDTDTLAEEKSRGLTIDIGFAPCKMADQRIVGIIDVPGHVDFVRNMVAGAHGVDVVIFVVAADDGVMPQTREHLDILTLMGVRHGLVALTKVDLVDQEMRELAIEDVRQYIQGSFLADAPICPISNITGEGFDKFFDALNAAADACGPRDCSGLFRMWVEDVFSIRGFGTVATGIPISGQVSVGERLRLVGAGPEAFARVRGLEVYGRQSQVGRSGECVAINLADAPHEGVHRGDLLCESDFLQPVSMFEAQLHVLPKLTAVMEDYAEVHVHVGTAEAMANIAILDGGPIAPGGSAPVQLRLKSPLCVACGDRFIIRATAAGVGGGHLTTLGGGRVLATSDVRLRRNRPWTIAMLAARSAAMDKPAAWCELMLKEAAAPLEIAELARRCHMPPAEAQAICDKLLADGAAVRVAAVPAARSMGVSPMSSTGVPPVIASSSSSAAAASASSASASASSAPAASAAPPAASASADVPSAPSGPSLSTANHGQDAHATHGQDGRATKTSGSPIVHRTIVDAVIASVVEHLEDFHKHNKLRMGIGEAELARAVAAGAVAATSDFGEPGRAAATPAATPDALPRAGTPQVEAERRSVGTAQWHPARGAPLDKAVFALALAELIRKGRVARQGTVVSLAGKVAKVSPADLELCSQIEAALAAAKIAPPSPYELSQQLASPLPRLEAMIRLLCDQGRVVRLDQNLVMHAAAVESAKQVALALFAAKGGFETVDFRDALGVSRKFAVPLLDYFDTIRLTVRSGSRRTPGAAARKTPNATS